MLSEAKNRRQFFLQTFLASSLTVAAPAWSQAAFEIRPWKGPASNLKLVDILGKTWTPADWKGRAVLLNFWASWCEPCRAEMPTLQQISDFYGPEKLLVLTVNFKEKPARALQFARSTGLSLPVLLDFDGQMTQRWGVKVFPSTLMLDRRGQPRYRVQGEVDWTGQAAEQLIRSLF